MTREPVENPGELADAALREREVSTSELGSFEVSAARAFDKLRVDKDGYGYVPRYWLEQFRSRKAYGAEEFVESLKKRFITMSTSDAIELIELVRSELSRAGGERADRCARIEPPELSLPDKAPEGAPPGAAKRISDLQKENAALRTQLADAEIMRSRAEAAEAIMKNAREKALVYEKEIVEESNTLRSQLAAVESSCKLFEQSAQSWHGLVDLLQTHPGRKDGESAPAFTERLIKEQDDRLAAIEAALNEEREQHKGLAAALAYRLPEAKRGGRRG